jgi:hypothetical protein
MWEESRPFFDQSERSILDGGRSLSVAVALSVKAGKSSGSIGVSRIGLGKVRS